MTYAMCNFLRHARHNLSGIPFQKVYEKSWR